MSRSYPERPIAAVAGVILDGDRVLLIRRGNAPRKGIWTFPGGGIELGETAREACAREVLEETGLTVTVGPVIDVVDLLEPDGQRWKRHYTINEFLVSVQPHSSPVRAGSDADDARWVHLSDMDEYDLTPIARHVLDRALWLRSTAGPTAPGGDARTIIAPSTDDYEKRLEV